MTLSETLIKVLNEGYEKGSPDGAAKLCFFKNDEGRENAENVFVLVVHYDFKDGVNPWPRLGNDKDVENLRKTFDENRNCRFRDLPSPKKDDLLALLANGQLLKKFFASEDAEPSVFIFIILSHGVSGGKIYTDTKIGSGDDDYDSFNTKQLFAKLEKTFANSLRLLFLGPCRGELTIGDLNLTGNYSSRVSFEPKMHNTIIFHSTVETTTADRDNKKGTWLVQCLCEQLNLMSENESIAHFSTGIQNRIHERAINAQPSQFTGKQTEQTMETKMFPHDKKLIFTAVENCACQNQSTIDFDWMNPHTKSVFRGKLAAIFHQGIHENAEIKKLKFSLVENLGFETEEIELDSQTVNNRFQELKEKSHGEYGCFAAFFFAEVMEEDNQVFVKLSRNEPIGMLIHSLLGSVTEWRGKPKLFFLIDVGTAAEDAIGQPSNQPIVEFPKATLHSGWMLFILRNKHLLPKLFEIFGSKEIKGERSLQECLSDLLVESNEDREEITPQAMLVSTLPHSLQFPQNFVKPNFEVKIHDSKEKKLNFEKLIVEAMNMKENQIWLLSSLPGSGKTTVMSEIALELRRRLCGVKVFNIRLLQDVQILYPTKNDAPSLFTVISSASRVQVDEIKILAKEKRMILMFDGFDEIHRKDAVLKLLLKAVKLQVPVWISTRLHEEDAILKKLRQQKICTVEILPLKEKQQIELLKMTSKKDIGECKNLIKNFQSNGSDDILSNPLHLTMIAKLEDSFSGHVKQNLFKVYDAIVEKKVHDMLKDNYIKGSTMYMENFENCESELQNISLSYLNNKSVKVLKYTRNGIVTLIEGDIIFDHQTFAEFLAARNYINSLSEKRLTSMPLDLLEWKYRQVRKFVEMKISESADETPNLKSSLELILSDNLTKKMIVEVLIRENLPTMFSLIESQISFSKNGSEVKFNFNSYQILKDACENSEEIALKLLDLGAFESLKFSQIKHIVLILRSAILNNFVRLFQALVTKCSTHSLIEKCRENNDEMNVAFMTASENNHYKMLKLVVESGIIDLYGEFGTEALDTAVERNSVELVEFLIQHGVPTDSQFCSFGNLYLKKGTVRALLGTTSNPREEFARRLFARAINGGGVEAAKFLQQEYRVVEKTDSYDGNTTALHEAANLQEARHSAALKICRWLVEECELKIDSKDDDGKNALHYAVRRGNLELVKYFMEKDPALIQSVDDFEGHNLLHFAVYRCREKTILEYVHDLDNHLIKQKTDINRTTLHLAAKNGNLDFCTWLVENGVDLEAVELWGCNAAHCAADCAEEEGVKILRYLHEKKPELLKQKTRDGKTVLHLASKNDTIDLDAIEWLMAQGLDPSDVEKQGWNALHVAAIAGNIEKMKFIHMKWPGLIESLTNNDENAMHLMAVSSCDEYKLKELHALCGKLVKQKTKTNRTVLHYAALSCFAKEKCKWLVEEIGLPIDSEDTDGWNVVHFAATKGNIETICFIHEKCPNLIEKATNDGENAMHRLMSCLVAKPLSIREKINDTEKLILLHALCEKLVKQKTKKNKNVLHYAMERNRDFDYFDVEISWINWFVDVIRLEMDAKNDDGWNALHFAASNGKFSYVKLIHEKCPNLIESVTNDDENVMHLMAANFLTTIDELKEVHALCERQVEQKTKTKKTVLHYAAQSHLFNGKEKLKWLVEEIGLEIEAEDNDGWNVVHFAANNNNDTFHTFLSLHILEYIKTKNSGLIVKTTKRKETALHIAAMKGNYREFKWLVRNGVDPEVKNVDGKTALQVAWPQNLEVFEQILGECPRHPIDQSFRL